MHYYQNPSPTLSPHPAFYSRKTDAGIVNKKDATNTNAISHKPDKARSDKNELAWREENNKGPNTNTTNNSNDKRKKEIPHE